MKAMHGGQVWAPDGSRCLRLDFSASLWPEPGLGLPRLLRHELEPYPDADCRALQSAAARHYGVSQNQVFACNGSTEGLYLAMRMLAPRRLALFEPTFSEYEAAASWAVGDPLKTMRLVTRPEDQFVPTLEAVDADVAVLGNPNNPTGALAPPAALAAWLDARGRAGHWTIVDEAFMDFVAASERHSLARKLRRWPRILVLRSMTKRFGIAGVRLGFVLGAPAAIARLRAARIPWSVNTLAQQLGVALAARPRDPRLPERIAALRRQLDRDLRRLNFETFASEANFLLMRMPRCQSNRRLLAALRRDGIGLRDASNFHGLDRSYLRCAVRPSAEAQVLVRSLAAALGARS